MIDNVTKQAVSANTFYMLNATELKEVIQGFVSDFLNKEKEREQEETLYTIEQVMKILQVTRTTLARWASNGYLVPIKIGKFVKYKKAEVSALMNER